jgi:hypothetical protein
VVMIGNVLWGLRSRRRAIDEPLPQALPIPEQLPQAVSP